MSDIYEMKSKTKLKNVQMFDLDDVRSAAMNKEFIELIKLYRGISGLGLKDSKEKIESYVSGAASQFGTRKYDIDGLIEAFKEHLVVNEPYTKEEFLFLIENAIDTMDSLHFTNMLDVVEVLCSNIRKKGGLEIVAKEANEFLRNV